MKSLCLPTSDSRVRFWCVMVNGAQSRSKLRRISEAKSSIRSCIGHKYVYVYELGCPIVALKSWYPYFWSDNPETPETTFMNETATESPRRVHSSRPTMTWLGTRFNIRLDPDKTTGDPLHSRALAHSRAPFVHTAVPHCSHSRAPGEQWARLCVFTLQGCVQAARLCRGSPVKTSHREIPWSLEAARFVFKIVPSLWNLRGTSAAVPPRRLCQNFQIDAKT